MQPLTLLIVFVAVWALTNFWLIPLVHANWAQTDLVAKVKRAAALTFLERVRDLGGVGAITLALLTVLIGIVALLGEGSATWTKETLDALSSAHRWVDGFASGYAQFLVWFGVVTGGIALFVSSKTARRRVLGAWQAEADRTRTRLVEDPEEREALRADPEFRTRAERLDELAELLGEEAAVQSPEQEALRLEAVLLLNEIAAEKSRKTLDAQGALGHGANCWWPWSAVRVCRKI